MSVRPISAMHHSSGDGRMEKMQDAGEVQYVPPHTLSPVCGELLQI